MCAWVPRDMANCMEGLTTNVELGMLMTVNPRKLVLGAPSGADSVGYLRQAAEDHVYLRRAMGMGHGPMNIPWYSTLEEMLAAAVRKVVRD